MAQKSGISADFYFCGNTLNLCWGGCIFISSDYHAAFKLPTFLSNDRKNLLEKQGLLMRKHTSQRLEQEGRLDALKLDYPKKTFSLSKLRTNQISS